MINRDLRQRVLSAAVLAPLVLLIVYLGGLAFAALIAVAAVLTAVEWTRLTECEDERSLAGTLVVVAILAVGLSHLGAMTEALVAIALGGGVLALLARWRRRAVLWPVLGLLWLALPCVALVWLRARPGIGLELLFGLLLVVWTCDSAAYFTGRAIGGPRLAPHWSPKKTWAGLVGGCLASAVVAGAWAHWSALAAPGVAALAGVIMALISQAGDIAESVVKRHFGVKDSGDLIPGHGGLLDRVDGLLFAAPATAVLVLLGGRGLA